MRNLWTLRCGIFLACVHLVACGTTDDRRATTYVVMSPTRVNTFLDDLSALSKTHGLTPSIGSATSDQGRTLHVLEARGKFLRLWAQNLPLDPGACGDNEFDAGQFLISVTPEMFLPLRDRARYLSIALTSELRAKGYRVLPNSVKPCSKAYLAGGRTQ
jgi:hypothetical protein